MGAVLFYHLTRDPAPVTMGVLLEKSLGAGWRVGVRVKTAEQAAAFDQALWKGPNDRFLPHGAAGGDMDADQPILISPEAEFPNNPACLMIVGGADVDPAEAEAYERVWVLFDGNDGDAVAFARQQWSAVKSAGVKAQYWSEDSGRWEKKAET